MRGEFFARPDARSPALGQVEGNCLSGPSLPVRTYKPTRLVKIYLSNLRRNPPLSFKTIAVISRRAKKLPLARAAGHRNIQLRTCRGLWTGCKPFARCVRILGTPSLLR